MYSGSHGETEQEKNRRLPDGLLIGFIVCTILVITIHLLAFVISTSILLNMMTVATIHDVSAVVQSRLTTVYTAILR